MTDYKATPEQWEAIAKYAKDLNSGPACLLELRARVEALEAGQRPASKVYEISKPLKLIAKQQQELNALLRPVTSQPSPNSSQIGSSLAERVEDALMESIKDQNSMARAAILEVAAWMTSNPDVYFPPALVFALEKEAEQ